jgi:hypothetical protein
LHRNLTALDRISLAQRLEDELGKRASANECLSPGRPRKGAEKRFDDIIKPFSENCDDPEGFDTDEPDTFDAPLSGLERIEAAAVLENELQERAEENVTQPVVADFIGNGNPAETYKTSAAALHQSDFEPFPRRSAPLVPLSANA